MDEELRRRIKQSARNLHNHAARVFEYTDDLLEESIAVKRNDLVTLPFKISKLPNDTAGMAPMKRQALGFAARTVIDDRIQPLSLSRKQRLAMTEGVQIP